MTIQVPNRKAKSIYRPILIMAVLLLLFAMFLVSLIQSGEAYSGYLYSPGPDDKEAPSDVAPIMDYMRPDKLLLENKSDYEERINHPLFLSDRENEDRLVEVSVIDQISLFLV
jgi:hypothetical protein